jgi:NAD-dependent dihydropyrimidine dehydrogenase PreA subunit
MLLLPQYLAYDVCAGYGQPSVSFAGPRREAAACYLWQSCHGHYGATFRALTADGGEYGTPRHGEAAVGVLVANCHDCGDAFVCPTVGTRVCPGCELLTIGFLALAEAAEGDA